MKNLLHTLFVKKSGHQFIEFFRYFFVSIVSLSTDFSLLYVLTSYVDLHYLISTALAYTAGLILNYFLSTSWVFGKKRLNNRTTEFFVFAAIGVVGLGVNEILMWVFTGVLLLHFMVSRMISAGIGYVWKYVVRKYFLFR